MDDLDSPQAQKRLRRFLALAGIAFVVCFLVLLGASVVHVFASARLAKQIAETHQDARALDLAMVRYIEAHKDTYPTFANGRQASEAIRPYLNDSRLQAVAPTYVWNTKLSGKKVTDLGDPGKVWILYSQQPEPSTRYVFGFADGHVASSPDSSLKKILLDSDRAMR